MLADMTHSRHGSRQAGAARHRADRAQKQKVSSNNQAKSNKRQSIKGWQQEKTKKNPFIN